MVLLEQTTPQNHYTSQTHMQYNIHTAWLSLQTFKGHFEEAL